MPYAYRIGADENGLGARLGPLVVTAVLARVTDQGERLLGRRLPKRLAEDLGDSKRLVSHKDFALGEAWARALVDEDVRTPAELFERLSLEGSPLLREPCPQHVESQCWTPREGDFTAEGTLVTRLREHRERLRQRGVEVISVKSSLVCTKRLNEARAAGGNRFVSDLHAMERLVIRLREEAGQDVFAVCGKVGGIEDYSRFFGPLSYRLHALLEQRRARSAYRFPGLGEVHFLQDADARDPLVMLASLVGKYVRELMMARVTGFYRAEREDLEPVSGYHDPATARFHAATVLLRRRREIPDDCFERARDAGETGQSAEGGARELAGERATGQPRPT